LYASDFFTKHVAFVGRETTPFVFGKRSEGDKSRSIKEISEISGVSSVTIIKGLNEIQEEGYKPVEVI
jgi:transcription initiation factor TFIIIB Brf1 subunit/transcription initiation factor TFIIB